jgi:phosphoglycerate kinase
VRFAEVLGRPVKFVRAITGPTVDAAVAAMADGDIILLENVRFDARETSKDPAVRGALAAELAANADFFVSDGFGVVHREQASVTDVARLLPAAAGDLVRAEVEAFNKVLVDPARPYVVVLGGSKVSDKLGVIANLLPRVDTLLIGGGMAFTFLAAQGHGVGDSLLETDRIDEVKGLLADAVARGVEIVLPVDVVISTELDGSAPVSVVAADAIPDGEKGLDIGPKSVELFATYIASAATIVWNGPMGVFETPAFATGTHDVAEAIASSSAHTVVGGGDSAAAVRLLDIGEARFSHISTGGGASLELLEGKVLPGLKVLEESA